MKFSLYLVSVWFGVLMILLVVLGAIAFAFTDFMIERLFGTKRLVFIFILLAYAVYRGFRLYHLLKSTKNEE